MIFLRKLIYTVADVTVSGLFKLEALVPAMLKPFVWIALFLPILVLAMYADWKGWSSDDVL
jgi:hypothetical protein